MKKKCELIKEYPGSPELGTIVLFHSVGAYYFDGGDMQRYTIKEIENYPEFWKEKKYVFTTEDNIDMYEGDEYWFISPNPITLHKNNANFRAHGVNNHNNNRRFCSEEAANTALKEEKEKLSAEYHKKDMLNVIRLASELMDTSKDFDLELYTPFSAEECEVVFNYYLNHKEKCNL